MTQGPVPSEEFTGAGDAQTPLSRTRLVRAVEWGVGVAVVAICLAAGWIVVDMFQREERARVAEFEADNAGIPVELRPRLVRDPERHAAQEQLVSLFGEVKRAGYYELPAAGGMTLGRLIDSAGGVDKGVAGEVSVLRRESGGIREVFRGPLGGLDGGEAAGVPVMPGDVVRVPG